MSRLVKLGTGHNSRSARRSGDESVVGGLGFVLDRVAHSLSRAFADALAPSGLTATGLGVLSALTRWGPMTQSELAAFLGVERQQVLHLIDTLAERDLVERKARASDRRVWDIRITTAGRQLRHSAAASGRQHACAAFAPLSDTEQAHLVELLLRLAPRGHYPRVLQSPIRP